MPETRFRVTGSVINAETTQGIRGLRVEAWDRDLVRDESLGTAITDPDGRFQFVFDRERLRELFDGVPDLLLRVYDGETLVVTADDDVLRELDGDVDGIEIEIEAGNRRDPTPLTDTPPDWGPNVWRRRFIEERFEDEGAVDPDYWREPLRQKNRMTGPHPREDDPGGTAPTNRLRAEYIGPAEATCSPVDHPKPGSVMADPERVVRLEGSGVAEGGLKLAVEQEELTGVDPATLRLFRWDERRERFELVHRSGLSVDGSYVWGRVRQAGIYATFGLPSDRARRDTARLDCLLRDWRGKKDWNGDLSLDTRVTETELNKHLCQLILCNEELLELYENPHTRELHGLEDEIGRTLAQYGMAEFDEKGRPISPRPQVESGVERFDGDVCDECLDREGSRSDSVECQLFDDKPKKNPFEPVDPVPSCSRWQSVGPTNHSGRVKAIEWHPTDADIVYAGNSQGGVFKSVNGGTEWFPLMEEQLSLVIGALAIAPSDPEVIYAATGEYSGTHSARKDGVGIYKSTDGGRSWQLLEQTNNDKYSQIVVHPTDSNIVFASGKSALERTLDGGTTWEVIEERDPESDLGGVSDLSFDPNDSHTLYVAFDDSKGVQKTTRAAAETATLKASSSWEPMNDGLVLAAEHGQHPYGNYLRLATGRDSRGETVLWCQLNSLDDTFEGNNPTSRDYGVAVYKWTGNQWDERSTPQEGDPPGGVAYKNWCSTIAVEPGSSDVVYSGRTTAYWTPNGGDNWYKLTTEEEPHRARAGHADHHAFAFDPSNKYRTLVGNDGGLYTCTRTANSDGPLEYEDANTGHDTIQFERIAVSRRGAFGLGGSTQDKGVLVNRDGTEWDGIGGAEWGDIQFAPSDGDVVYWDPKWRQHYPLLRSGDGGLTKRLANNGLGARYVSRLAIHPTDPDRVLAATPSSNRPRNRPGVLQLPADVLHGRNDFTVALWIRTTRSGSFGLLSAANETEDNEATLFKSSSGVWMTYLKGTKQSYGRLGLEDGQWHHLTWVREGGDESVYVDGVRQGSNTVEPEALDIAAHGLVLGQEQDHYRNRENLDGWTKFDSKQAFVGELDDVRVYESALSPGQIEQAMAGNVAAWSSRRAHYTFESHFVDITGNGYHARASHLSFEQGKYGLCVTFPPRYRQESAVFRSVDGGRPYPAQGFSQVIGPSVVRLPSGVADGLGDFTVAVWFRTTQDSSYALVSGANTSQQNELLLFRRTGRNEIETILDGTTQKHSISGLEDGSWHHIVWTRAGGTERLFVDDAEVGSNPVTNSLITVSPGGFVVGQEQDEVGSGFNSREAFIGHLDELRIYEEALSASQVSQLYDWRLDAEASLRAHYPFDRQVRDESGNGYHGFEESVAFGPGRSGWGAAFQEYPATVSDIAFAPSDPRRAYAVTKQGGVWMSRDTGTTWEKEGTGPEGTTSIASLTVDWHDVDRLYVTYTSLYGGRVFRSDDAGDTWDDISGKQSHSAIPMIPTRRVVVNTNHSDTLYAVTDIGIFRTTDGGDWWQPFDEGLPNALTTDIDYRTSTNTLYVSTYGRGAYKYTL